MFIIKYRKVWFALSAILIAASIWSIFAYGFKLSIDFKGGTLTELSFEQRLYQTEIESKLSKLDLGSYSIRPSGEKNYVIRTRELNQAEKKLLTESVGGVTERQNTVGPTVGAELQSKALKAIVVVVMMIVLFITFAFRKVSASLSRGIRGVSSWKYGLATIIALAHDVIIPAGIFVYLGHEIDLLFVTGLLAILGYSVHDTIVVFDRVRENLRINQEQNRDEDFEVTVGKSVNQTFTRSINTSVTIFITLLALYIFGSAATQTFSLLLIIGLIAGTYSSIFVASPLLVTFYKLQRKRAQV
ncbi:MAG TPA: protein translocase subunit SecF [Candidatus Paceibacterota bacterium]